MATHPFCWPRANKKAYVLDGRGTGPDYFTAWNLAMVNYFRKLSDARVDADRFAARDCGPSCDYKKIVYTSNYSQRTRVTGGGAPGVPVTVVMVGGFTINVVCARDKTEAKITEKRLKAKAKVKKKKAGKKKSAKKKKKKKVS